MDRLLEPLMIRRVGVAMATVWAATLATVYAIWLSDGCQAFMPFISDTDVYPGTDLAFTIGLTLAGALMLLSSWQIGTYRGHWLEASGVEPKWVTVNRFGMMAGMAAAICVIWIADTPWNENLYLHIAQAFVIFGGGLTFIFCQTLLTDPMAQIEPRFESLKKPRLTFLILTIASICLIFLNFLKMSAATDDISFTGIRSIMDAHFTEVETCTTLTHQALSEAAFFEWTMTAGLGLSLLTVLPEISILTSSTSDDSEE